MKDDSVHLSPCVYALSVVELSFENSPGMILVIRVDGGKTVDSILKVSSYKAVSGIARNFISEMHL